MTTQVATQGHGFILDELAELDVGERAISARRKDLHLQIDMIYLSAPLDAAKVVLLDRLEGDERDISEQRRQLHAVIDGLRAQVGVPRWREAN